MSNCGSDETSFGPTINRLSKLSGKAATISDSTPSPVQYENPKPSTKQKKTSSQ